MEIIASNITSPLGLTTQQNLDAVYQGNTQLREYNEALGVPESFCASLFDDEQKSKLQLDGFTWFESLVLASAREALSQCDVDVADSRNIFLLSSTKGDIGVSPGITAQKIAKALGFTTTPVVACNACISGVSAQILALRLAQTGCYDHIVVCGADVQSKFIISGFQSLKAVSTHPCRPFDMERLGLNLGEAAGTIVFSCNNDTNNHWHLLAGATRNDAVHISNPSKTAEGSYRAIQQVVDEERKKQLSVISVHGTATMYNDQMESVAIKRAELSDIPTIALKGYYGHTMGAAGVIETILSVHFVERGEIPPTRGFEELGVSGKVRISSQSMPVHDGGVLKMISGFGGCNAALYLDRHASQEAYYSTADIEQIACINITSQNVSVNGQALSTTSQGKALLTELYKRYAMEYPKFYKMDMLSRLTFVASELLLQGNDAQDTEDYAIVLFNSSSSIVSDKEYMTSITPENYYPSPSVFVYTLPNIATGEIAIRHRFYGETSFYILPHKDEAMMNQIINATLNGDSHTSLITGWVDCFSQDDFEIELKLVTKKQ